MGNINMGKIVQHIMFLMFLICLICDAVKTPKQVKSEKDLESMTSSAVGEALADMKEAVSKETSMSAREAKKRSDEVKKLESDAVSFTRKAELAKEGFGEFSEERASMLHTLGRTVYKLERYDEALKHSKEIVRIYETLHGIDALETSAALGNVASVSYRIHDIFSCEKSMLRALRIILTAFKDRGGEGSKEVLMHRAKMLTFGIEAGSSSMGISYEEYLTYKGEDTTEL